MSFISKNPRVDSLIETDIAAGTPSNPAAGSHKIIDRNGFLFMRDSAGAETAVTPEVSQTTSGLVLSAGQLLATDTNDDAASGYTGEYFNSGVMTVTGTNNQFGDVTSVVFGPGDYELSSTVSFINITGATLGSVAIGFGTVTGNDDTGLIEGDNYLQCDELGITAPGSQFSLNLSGIRLTVATATTSTIYLKFKTVGTVLEPTTKGSMKWRRFR